MLVSIVQRARTSRRHKRVGINRQACKRVDVRRRSDLVVGDNVRVHTTQADRNRSVLGNVHDVINGDRAHRWGRDLGVKIEGTAGAGNVAHIQRPNQHHIVAVGTNRVGVDRPAVARTSRRHKRVGINRQACERVDVRRRSDLDIGDNVRVHTTQADRNRSVLGNVHDVINSDRAHRWGRDLGVKIEGTAGAGNVARIVQRPNQHHIVAVGTNRVSVDRPAVARTGRRRKRVGINRQACKRVDVRRRSDLDIGDERPRPHHSG